MPPKGYKTLNIRVSTYNLLNRLSKKYNIPKTALIDSAVRYYVKTVLEPIVEGGILPPQLIKYLRKHLRLTIVEEREVEEGGEE